MNKRPSVTEASVEKARGMTPVKLGAWFEDHLKTHLKYLSSQEKMYAYRMPDTKAAGNYLPDSPADFLLMTTGVGGILLEAKASAKHCSLRSCLSSNVSTAQALHHRLWSRAGGRSFFLFCSVKNQTLELWDGRYVGDCRAKGDVLDKEVGMVKTVTITKPSLEDVLRTLL